MSISERLQEIDEKLGNYKTETTKGMTEFVNDFVWMHDTIKQQQERLAELEEKLKASDYAIEYGMERELEKQKKIREITAAHVAFLRNLKLQRLHYSATENQRVLTKILVQYHECFEFIHLAEQVRQAKLSAGVDEG